MRRADQAEAAGNPAKAEAYLRAAGNYIVAKGEAGRAGELIVDGRSLPRMFANPPKFRWHAGHSMYGDNSARMASMSPQPSMTWAEIEGKQERLILGIAALPVSVGTFIYSAPVSAGHFTIRAVVGRGTNLGFQPYKYKYDVSKVNWVDFGFSVGTGEFTGEKASRPRSQSTFQGHMIMP